MDDTFIMWFDSSYISHVGTHAVYSTTSRSPEIQILKSIQMVHQWQHLVVFLLFFFPARVLYCTVLYQSPREKISLHRSSDMLPPKSVGLVRHSLHFLSAMNTRYQLLKPGKCMAAFLRGHRDKREQAGP